MFDNDGKLIERSYRPNAASFFDKFWEWVGVDGEVKPAPGHASLSEMLVSVRLGLANER
jgi:hypothetical protein